MMCFIRTWNFSPVGFFTWNIFVLPVEGAHLKMLLMKYISRFHSQLIPLWGKGEGREGQAVEASICVKC